MARRPLTVVLSKDEYLQLAKLAEQQERTTPQQATFLLRQRLKAEGQGVEA